MATIAYSDYLQTLNAGVLVPKTGVYVQLVSNNTGTAYVSDAATDSTGKFNFATKPPGDTYTVNTGPSSGGAWTAFGDSNYAVPVVQGETPAFQSTTELASGPYVPSPAATPGFQAMAYGSSPAVSVGPTMVNLQAAGADMSGGTFSDTALATALAQLPTGGGTIYTPPGLPKFQVPVVVPNTMVLAIEGSNKTNSVWKWQGTQQAFLTFQGGNQGSRIKDIGIMGALADPAVLFQSSVGGGGTAYESFIGIIDAFIGYGYQPGGTARDSTFRSYSGMTYNGDLLQTLNTIFYGQNFGLRLQSCTDIYLTNSSFSANCQGGEPRGIGLWCEDVLAGRLFQGSIHIDNCSAAAPGPGTSEAAVLVRSVADIKALYIEQTNGIPLKVVTCALRLVGGSIKTSVTGGTQLIQATGSHGMIDSPVLGCPVGANSLVNLISTTGSPFTKAWDIRLLNKAQILGTLPGTLLAIDQPRSVKGVGYYVSGMFGVTVTASPFTYTNANPNTVMLHIHGGTVTTVVKDGTTVANFAGGAAQIDLELECGEAVTVTYTVAPTVSVDIKTI